MHSLILATEEERNWMIDRETGLWFDWQNGEWKDMPKHWLKLDNWGILNDIQDGNRKARGSAYYKRHQAWKLEIMERIRSARKKRKPQKYKRKPAPDFARFVEIAKKITSK